MSKNQKLKANFDKNLNFQDFLSTWHLKKITLFKFWKNQKRGLQPRSKINPAKYVIPTRFYMDDISI